MVIFIFRNRILHYLKRETITNEIKVSAQPDSITYYLGRDQVLNVLPNDKGEVIMLGNSLTQNFEWHEVFKDITIKNRGISSDITKGVLNRLNEVVDSKPSKIFIEIGINDLMEGFPIDTVFNNYIKIMNTINRKSPDTKIYVQSLLPTKMRVYTTNEPVIELVRMFNNRLQEYCKNQNVIYIDLYSHFELNNELNLKYDCGDNLHLNGLGYKLWCDLIKKDMNE